MNWICQVQNQIFSTALTKGVFICLFMQLMHHNGHLTERNRYDLKMLNMLYVVD